MSSHLQEYQTIQEQIRVLGERAAQLLTEGRAEAVASIITMVGIYDITAAEVGLVAKPAAPKRNRKRTVNPRPPLYRDPVSGATWTGQGASPKWLDNAERERFLIRDAGFPTVQSVA